jgi:hypothetical protein
MVCRFPLESWVSSCQGLCHGLLRLKEILPLPRSKLVMLARESLPVFYESVEGNAALVLLVELPPAQARLPHQLDMSTGLVVLSFVTETLILTLQAQSRPQ